MKGFPKYFNIKQDVLNTLAVYPKETKDYLKNLIDERFNWLPTEIVKQDFVSDGKAASFDSAKKLTKGDKETIDATHRVTELKDDKTQEITERYQEEYKEDPNCKLFRLGFTVEEAQTLIKVEPIIEEPIK